MNVIAYLKNLGIIPNMRISESDDIPYHFSNIEQQVGFRNMGLRGVEELGHSERVLLIQLIKSFISKRRFLHRIGDIPSRFVSLDK